MFVYVVVEVEPSGPNEPVVFSNRTDALAHMRGRFDYEIYERGWDEATLDREHPESCISKNDAVVGDIAEDSNWIYWHIYRRELH